MSKNEKQNKFVMTEEKLKWFMLTASEVLAVSQSHLKKAGYSNILYKPSKAGTTYITTSIAGSSYGSGNGYLYAEGTIPVMLVAHVDTAHVTLPKRKDIAYDAVSGMVWSLKGLGADDRAGVMGIFELLNKGFRPHVLLLDGEEKGGLGAKEAVKDITSQRMKQAGLRYIIELDRRGINDAVFYDCFNEAFTKYVTYFGFTEATGSFSDISTLCPAWDVAGVNLSTGYHNEHTNAEYFMVGAWAATLAKVVSMLKNVPKKSFKYTTKPKAVATSTSWYTASYSKYLDSWKYDGVDYTKYDKYKDKDDDWKTMRDDITLYVTVDLDEMEACLGGTAGMWRKYFRENRQDVQKRLQNMVYDGEGVDVYGLHGE